MAGDIGGDSGTLLGILTLLVGIVGAFIAWMFRIDRKSTRTETRVDNLERSYWHFRKEHKEEHEKIENETKEEMRDALRRVRQIERDHDRGHRDATDATGLGRDDLEPQ